MSGIKIGCDIVSLNRFKRILSRTPNMRHRIFLPQEERSASLERLAGIFAAKEAAMKALGIPPGRWQDIEVVHKEDGRPDLKIRRGVSVNRKISLSIAHDGAYVIAFVVIG